MPNREETSLPGVNEWQAYCARANEEYKSFTQTIKTDVNIGGFQSSRDSIEIVRPYIRERQHPITLLTDLAVGLKRDIGLTRDTLHRAVLYRDLVLIEIGASNPVRISNAAEMRFVEGKRGHEEDDVNLYRKEDGSWHLKYEVYELKNGVDRGRYDLPVNPMIWPDIEEYIYNQRPLLFGPESPYVFRHIMRGWIDRCSDEQKKKLRTSPMLYSGLSDKFVKYSQRFIPGCAGFGAHSCRHIVATEWLKNNPGSYAVAASILHDSEQVVKEAYDWCEPKDKAVFWYQHLSQVFGEMTAGRL